MCGNIGLLLLKQAELDGKTTSTKQIDFFAHITSTDIEAPAATVVLGDECIKSSNRISSSKLLSKLLANTHTLDTSSPQCAESSFCFRDLPLEDPVDLIESMAKLTEMRGGQSAGLASIEVNRGETKFFLDRQVISKRGRASAAMVEKFRWKSKSFQRAESVLLMGHLRFATSSRNKESESHPHIWEKWRKEQVWKQLPKADGSLEYVRAESLVGHTLTHNGDFDAVEMFDSPVPMKQAGLYFERILQTPISCNSDSNKIAGYFDLFDTKGRWGASARRAWVLSLSDSLNEVCGEEDLVIGAPNTAPTVAIISLWGSVFETAFQGDALSTICSRMRKSEFISALDAFNTTVSSIFIDAKKTYSMHDFNQLQIEAFVSETINGFLTADTFSTMSTFLKTAHGSFGLAVTSATECGAVVLSAQGQPMCFAIDPEVEIALYGSESNAIRIPVQSNGAPLRYRYNINDNAGEVVRIGVNNFNMFNLEVIREVNREEVHGVRPIIVPFTQGLTLCFDGLGVFQELDDVTSRFILQPRSATAFTPSKKDLVLRDITDIPHVLREITMDWGDPDSPNRKTANDFVHLLAATRLRHSQNKEMASNSIDLLITGIESSLWLGEQLASDLRLIFPKINCIAVSSNKLLGSLENVPRSVHFCGYNRIRGEDLRHDRPVVLCLSQSGQTFATLHATRQLLNILGGNVFLVTGDDDSKMRQAVSDDVGHDIGDRRVMCNLSGLRVAEASSVACCAMHHTLTELILYVGQCACVADEGKSQLLELSVDREDLIDFRDLVDSVHCNIPGLVGEGGKTNTKLRAQGQYWASHITETWRVIVLCSLYILVTVISGYPLFSALVTISKIDGEGVRLVGKILDALLYIAMPKLLSYSLRFVEDRSMFARHGKRTLVICECPWVHQHLENYVSKLFALSYGVLSIDVHSACAHDEMVHCFTHRVARGTLLALGRPDGRVLSLLKTEQTIMLAAKQAAFIENMGCGPEFLTLGHNNVQSSIAMSHVCIPSNRRKFLCESLYDLSLAAISQSMNKEEFAHATKLIMASLYSSAPKSGSRKLLTIGNHHAHDAESPPRPKSFQNIAASTSPSNSSRNVNDEEEKKTRTNLDRQFSLMRSKSVKNNGRGVFDSDPSRKSWVAPSNTEGFVDSVRSKKASATLSLSARYAFTSKLPTEIRRTLERVQPIEHLFESRVASFERYISFLVMFHGMAEAASNPWLLPAWDIARSQSNLRVATTACPVSVEDDDAGEDRMHHHMPYEESQELESQDRSQHDILQSQMRHPELSSALSEHFPAADVQAVLVPQDTDDEDDDQLGAMKGPPIVRMLASTQAFVASASSRNLSATRKNSGRGGGDSEGGEEESSEEKTKKGAPVRPMLKRMMSIPASIHREDNKNFV